MFLGWMRKQTRCRSFRWMAGCCGRDHVTSSLPQFHQWKNSFGHGMYLWSAAKWMKPTQVSSMPAHCSVQVKSAASAGARPSPPIHSKQRNSIWLFYFFLTISDKKTLHLSASGAAAPAQLFHQYIQVMCNISRAASIYGNINAEAPRALKGNSDEEKQIPPQRKEKLGRSFHSDAVWRHQGGESPTLGTKPLFFFCEEWSRCRAATQRPEDVTSSLIPIGSSGLAWSF